jgi:hypothetical protein
VSSFDYFCHLASGMGGFMAYFGFISVPLLLVVVHAFVWRISHEAIRTPRVLFSCIIPGLIPVCILTIGVAFVRPEFTAWAPGVTPPVPWFPGWPLEYPQTALTALLWLHVPIAVGLACWSRRGWPAVVAAGLWWAWVSVCARAVADNSVTGQWL